VTNDLLLFVDSTYSQLESLVLYICVRLDHACRVPSQQPSVHAAFAALCTATRNWWGLLSCSECWSPALSCRSTQMERLACIPCASWQSSGLNASCAVLSRNGCRALQVLDARAIGAHLGPCKGYGFVTMGSIETAAAAVR
jgi:hypothetical protein